MPRSLPGVVAVGLALTTMFALTACDTPPSKPGAIAFVVGGRNNMPAPVLNAAARSMLREAVLNNEELYIVGVSTTPPKLYYEHIDQHCDSGASCDAVVGDYQAKVSRLIGRVRASVPEADTLGAIGYAARAIAHVTGGPRQIIVIDSGLQTTGELHLQNPGVLSDSTDPVDLANRMRDDHRLEPTLAGDTVLMTGLGETAPPQQPLGQKKRAELVALWQAVLRASGAQVTIDQDAPVSGPPAQSLPPVIPVPVDDQPITVAACTPIRADQVGFQPDSPEFIDKLAALDVLRPIARKLLDEHASATLIGTTALPDATGPGSLSQKRADAVKALLVELGVPADSLTTQGVGTNFDAYPKPPAAPPRPDELPRYRLVIVKISGADC